MLTLFDLIQLSFPEVRPDKCKLHMARPNPQGEHPLDVFKHGEFDEWQCGQTNQNFTRPYVVSLIAMRQPGNWLFAGVYTVEGEPSSVANEKWPEVKWKYKLTKLKNGKALDGRVVVQYEYKDRQSYPYAEGHIDKLIVSEILSDKPKIDYFKGFRNVNISFKDLSVIVEQSIGEWRAPLTSVKGIYLISDPDNGKAYVGKADGKDGFWGRFTEYAKSFHGGNKGLKGRIDEVGVELAENWRLSILEVVDLDASNDLVLERETFWKEVLMTRGSRGYNHN